MLLRQHPIDRNIGVSSVLVGGAAQCEIGKVFVDLDGHRFLKGRQGSALTCKLDALSFFSETGGSIADLGVVEIHLKVADLLSRSYEGVAGS